MAQIEELLEGKSQLSADEISHLKKIASDWQLIADLSFADLAIWVETNENRLFFPAVEVQA